MKFKLVENVINEKESPKGYAPKKTGKAYKVFKVKNGKLYPPMVANAGGQDTPIGVWLDAEEGEFAGLSKTGRPQVKSTQSSTLAESITKNRIYSIWRHMKDRCYNPNNNCYHLYGGKGIEVCDDWMVYKNFQEWALKNGYDDSLSIDRIDNSKNYEPSNCRFSDPITQSNNTSRNVYLTFNGKTQSIAQWERELGYPRHLIQRRRQSGWSDEDAIVFPPIRDRVNKQNGRFKPFNPSTMTVDEKERLLKELGVDYKYKR